MPDTTVKYFDSTMSGAPTLSATAETLIGVLDACLVNGFGSVTLDSLVVASNVATGTLSTGHGFAMVGNTGPVIKIEGATPSGLNGEWRLASVPTANTFTFATSGITDQTATGTITAKRAPAGFSKAFSGANKAAYRSLNVASTQLYLRVLDDAATATLEAYETMSDVDTGTGKSTGIHYFVKTYNTAVPPWRVVADGSALYVFSANTDGIPTIFYGMFYAGDIDPILSTDAFHYLLIGHYNSGSSNTQLMGLGPNNRNGSIARSHTQVGSAIITTRRSHVATDADIGSQNSVVSYPNSAGGDFLAAPVEVWTNNETILRGWMPGLWNPLHPGTSLTSGALMEPSTGTPAGRTLQITRHGNNALSMDLTGPWR